jgi:hypothetical protein
MEGYAAAMDQLVCFDRPFQLWKYAVSHGQLLFRSPKSKTCSTRVEVLFKGVAAMLVRSDYDRLVVHVASEEEGMAIAEASGFASLDGRQLYVLEGQPNHFVIAAVVLSLEDDGEYFDPSQLLTDSL